MSRAPRGGTLRLEVPQTVQIDLYDVIFKNNTAPSSADLWTDDVQLTTINLPLASQVLERMA